MPSQTQAEYLAPMEPKTVCYLWIHNVMELGDLPPKITALTGGIILCKPIPEGCQWFYTWTGETGAEFGIPPLRHTFSLINFHGVIVISHIGKPPTNLL